MDAFLNPVTKDYVLTNGTFDRDPDDGIANAIYIRLMTPLGSYWADPTLGSRLHELQREKDVPRVGILAKQFSENALAPLIADERVTSVSVEVVQPHAGLLFLFIEVVDQTDRKLSFKYPVKVY